MYKLVIFDLDGTLLNTIGDLAESCNYALKMCGYEPHPVSAYNFFVGNGIMKLFERALPEDARDAKTLREMREYFLWHYERNNNVKTKPYDGIIELLASLQRDNYMLAVASNKYQEATENIVKDYFGGFDFVKVLGQRDSIPIKPNPHIINEILDAAQVNANETIYVGDSGVDASTATNVKGITFIGATWGFRPKKELEENGAEIFANSPEDILNIIKR
ncbi:MAG: HAD family hydrolase [Muribaculaceae bacterium]|nr:HAD family hydrolase [Muribaculaceae bacterium]